MNIGAIKSGIQQLIWRNSNMKDMHEDTSLAQDKFKGYMGNKCVDDSVKYVLKNETTYKDVYCTYWVDKNNINRPNWISRNNHFVIGVTGKSPVGAEHSDFITPEDIEDYFGVRKKVSEKLLLLSDLDMYYLIVEAVANGLYYDLSPETFSYIVLDECGDAVSHLHAMHIYYCERASKKGTFNYFAFRALLMGKGYIARFNLMNSAYDEGYSEILKDNPFDSLMEFIISYLSGDIDTVVRSAVYQQWAVKYGIKFSRIADKEYKKCLREYDPTTYRGLLNLITPELEIAVGENMAVALLEQKIHSIRSFRKRDLKVQCKNKIYNINDFYQWALKKARLLPELIKLGKYSIGSEKQPAAGDIILATNFTFLICLQQLDAHNYVVYSPLVGKITLGLFDVFDDFTVLMVINKDVVKGNPELYRFIFDIKRAFLSYINK